MDESLRNAGTELAGAHTSALTAALRVLRCPHCIDQQAGMLQLIGPRQAGCVGGHHFDLAKQGYLPLLSARSRTDTGDSAHMVADRVEFLAGRHFSPIAEAVAEHLTGAQQICEIGAGTGYYLAAALDASDLASPSGIAVDSSKYAARRAAAAHPQLCAVLADAWAPLPIGDETVDAVMVIFAPRAPVEVTRVLRPGGRAVIVTPGPDHLAEIAAPLHLLHIADDKSSGVRRQFDGLLEPVTQDRVRFGMTLDAAALRALVGMGPAARHRTPEQIAESVANTLDGAQQLTVTGEVTITVLQR